MPQKPIRIVVYGTGRMGEGIARTFAADARFAPVLAAHDAEALHAQASDGVRRVLLPGGLRDGMPELLGGADAVVMAGEAWAKAADVAELARQCGCHYLDIAESPASAEEVRRVAEGAERAFVPACGLAPGYVTALVGEVVQRSGPEAEIAVLVGVLPARRTNRLGYGNLWGIDGLIVEYTSPCRAIREGAPVDLPPLTELEEIALNGERFEAFTTAGSLDALVQGSAGRVRSLVFKTLRYPGHLDYIRFLVDDLGLGARRYQLRSLLMNGLPPIEEDRVLIVIRHREGPDRPEHRRDQIIEAAQTPRGSESAIVRATAAHVCSVADLLCSGALEARGFVPQSAVPLELLRRSRFFDLLAAGAADASLQGKTTA